MWFRAFRWYGGKYRMLSQLTNLIPEHSDFYEPFAGSAVLLLNHPRSKSETISDTDKEIYNFMNLLSDKEYGAALVDALKKIDYSEETYNKAKSLKDNNFAGINDFEKALRTYILITQSFNGTRKSFSAKAYKSKWHYRNLTEQNIPKVYNRLQGVNVKNEDGIKILEEIKHNPNAFAFVDPPYRKELRGKNAGNIYGEEFKNDDKHIELLTTIRDAKCKILLCGYKSKNGKDLYDEYLLTSENWHCFKLRTIAKSAQVGKAKKDFRDEYIWLNYLEDLPYSAQFVISLKEQNSLDSL